MSADNARKISELVPHGRRPGGKRGFTEAEGLEAKAAYARGVTAKEIAVASGCSKTNFYALMGTWALRFCKCGDHHAR